MFLKLEEDMELLPVTTSGSFGVTRTTECEGKKRFVKLFTDATQARLTSEYIVSTILSQALQDVEDKPEFPDFHLVQNQEDAIIGFSSTEVADPINIDGYAAPSEFYKYLQTTGCAAHAAARFFFEDPDGVFNQGWQKKSKDPRITFIDMGLAFYKHLAETGQLVDEEKGKLPDEDIFAANSQNLLLWLMKKANGECEQFSPFHAFHTNPKDNLFPKKPEEIAVMREFYKKYFNALRQIANASLQAAYTLFENTPLSLMTSVAKETLERIRARACSIRLCLDSITNLDDFIAKAFPIVTATPQFQNKSVLFPAKTASAQKENVPTQKQGAYVPPGRRTTASVAGNGQ